MSFDLPTQTPTTNQNPIPGAQTPSITPPPAPVIPTPPPPAPTPTSPTVDTFKPTPSITPPPFPGAPLASASPSAPAVDPTPLVTSPPPSPVPFARPVAPLSFPSNNSFNPPAPRSVPQSPNPDANIDPTSPAEIEKLTNQLLADLGLPDLDGKDKEEVISAIRERVNNTILLTLLENLNEHDADELEEKLKAGATDEEALELLAGKAINHTDKFATALANLYNELKETIK